MTRPSRRLIRLCSPVGARDLALDLAEAAPRDIHPDTPRFFFYATPDERMFACRIFFSVGGNPRRNQAAPRLFFVAMALLSLVGLLGGIASRIHWNDLLH